MGVISLTHQFQLKMETQQHLKKAAPLLHRENKALSASAAQTIDYGNVIYKTVNREPFDIQLTL